MDLSLTHRHHQHIKLDKSQALALDTRQLRRQRELVGALHEAIFTPKASCEGCGYVLTDLEIMRGFSDDPTDYTTECPKCRKRFMSRLFRNTDSGSIEVAFLCPGQTLARLHDMADVTLDVFRTREASVYNSAVIHFGGLRQAFAEIGLTYAHEADLGWRSKVVPFLGSMPDPVIARLVGTSHDAIRRLRKKHGLNAYSRREDAEHGD